MKRLYYFILTCLPVSLNAGVVTFSRTFGGGQNDYAHSIQQTADGGYIVGGQTDSYDHASHLFPDMWIIKTDSTGNKEWEKTFGGEEGDVAFCVRQTKDLGYIVAGTTSSFGKKVPSIWILKLDAKGDSVWSKIFEGAVVSSAQCIRQTDDGGYIVAGNGKENILKLDQSGRKEWGKHYSRILYSVEQTRDGGYIASGDTIFKQLEWNYIPSVSIIKLNKDGNPEWSNPLGNAFPGSAYSVQQTSDEGYVFTGDSIGFKSGNDHSHYSLTVKLDKTGKIKWIHTGSEYSSTESICQTADDGFILAGNTLDPENGLNLFMMRLDVNGNEKWVRSYGKNQQWEYASSVQQSSDGGYVVAGQTESAGAGRYDIWIIKTDENGNLNPTGILKPKHQQGFLLSDNYPNPFSTSTTFAFQLRESGYVTLTLYDMTGKEQEAIFSGYLPPGEMKVQWIPRGLSGGTYLYRLQQGYFSVTKSLVYLK
jgi:hypothetical protein